MLTRNRLMTLTGLLLALVAVWLKVPLASSQGLTIAVTGINGPLPVTELDSELWRQATAVEVPLSAQIIARPILPQTNIHAVTVRGLHNGDELALLVEWADTTRNESTLRPEDFRDGVAIQFPLAEGLPFFCMGQQGGNVNIWHWKADWQADIVAQRTLRDAFPNMYVDYYPFTEEGGDVLLAAYTDVAYLPAVAAQNLMAAPDHATPVENLIAGGFSALTGLPAERQIVQGHGEWHDGVWRVIFARTLRTDQPEDVALAPEQVYSVAFAAWDGANEERNGAKSTSQWVSLQLLPPAASSGQMDPSSVGQGGERLPLWAWLVMLVTLALMVWAAVHYANLGKRGQAA